MIRRLSSAAGVGLVLLAACQPSNKPQPLTGADSTAINKARTDYITAWNTGNVNALVALHVPLPELQAPDRPTLRGAAALRAYFDTALGTPTRPTIDIKQGELIGRQDLAVMSGTFTLTPPAPPAPAKGAAPAPPPPMAGKFLVVLRNWEGAWKIQFHAISFDAPMAPPAPPKAGRAGRR